MDVEVTLMYIGATWLYYDGIRMYCLPSAVPWDPMYCLPSFVPQDSDVPPPISCTIRSRCTASHQLYHGTTWLYRLYPPAAHGPPHLLHHDAAIGPRVAGDQAHGVAEGALHDVGTHALLVVVQGLTDGVHLGQGMGRRVRSVGGEEEGGGVGGGTRTAGRTS